MQLGHFPPPGFLDIIFQLDAQGTVIPGAIIRPKVNRRNKTPVQIKKTCLEIRTVVSYLKMIKKKMCLIGPFGVGKTSLIRKYVLNIKKGSLPMNKGR